MMPAFSLWRFVFGEFFGSPTTFIRRELRQGSTIESEHDQGDFHSSPCGR